MKNTTINVSNYQEIISHYRVNENGEIFDIDKKRIVKQHITKNGYFHFYCKEIQRDVSVHRFIMI